MKTLKQHRLFISSTFQDMEIERQALRERVFPKLREFALKSGCALQLIDLQWGISLEDARRHDTMSLCFREIERCRAAGGRPYLLFILGQRHGWVPPPARLPEQLGDALSELFFDRDLFEIWYCKDQNAVPPDYRLVEIPFSQRPESLERLGEEIRQAALKLDLQENDRRLLLGSATEQEIAFGLSSGYSPLGQPVIGLVRILKNDPLPPTYGSADREARRNQERVIEWAMGTVPDIWKEEVELVNGALPAEYLDRICNFVIDTFQHKVFSIAHRTEPSRLTDAEANALLADRFASDLVMGQRERSLLAWIDAQDTSTPLAITGPPGLGKTSLLSLLARERARHEKVILRLIGAAPPRPRLMDLLESIIAEIAEYIGEKYQPIPPTNPAAAAAELERALRILASQQTATLIIDSLDQLELPAALSVGSWIPRHPPSNIRIVVSSRPASWIDENRNLRRIELEHLSDDDAELVLREVLRRDNRQLQPHQTQAIINSSQGIPLLLRLNAIDAMRWKDLHIPAPMTKSVESTGLSLYRLITDTLGHGERLVLVVLGLLYSARFGLNEEEILGACSFDAEILAEQTRRTPDAPPTDELPYSVWSRLLADLEPFLSTQSTLGGPLWTLKHRAILESLNTELETRGLSIHCSHLLTEYFSREPWTIGTDGSPNVRKLVEYPFHLARCGRADEFWATLINPIVLTATFELLGMSGLSELLDLGETWLDSTRRADLIVLKSMIEQIAPASMWDRETFPSLLDEQLRRGTFAEATLRAGLAASHRPWLRLSSSSSSPVQTSEFIDIGTGVGPLAVSANGAVLAAIGYELPIVFIWDLASQELIAKIKDAHWPIGISPDGRFCVSGCGRPDKIQISDISTLETIAQLEVDVDDTNRRITLTRDSVVIAAHGEISLFSLWNGRLLRVIRFEKKILCAGASIDAQVIVGGCSDGSLAVFRSQGEIQYLAGNWGPIDKLAVSADGGHVASVSKKKRFLVDYDMVVHWDLAQQQNQLISRHRSTIKAIDISADGSVIAWHGTFENSAAVFGPGDMNDVRYIGEHANWVEGAAVSPNGKTVFTGGREGSLQISLVEHSPVHTVDEEFETLQGRVTAIALPPEENELFVTSYGRKGNFASVDPWSGRVNHFWNVHTEDVNDVAITGNGAVVASVSDDGRLAIHTKAGDKLWVWDPHRGCMNCVDITDDGNWVAVGFTSTSYSELTWYLRNRYPRGARSMRWRRADGQMWLLNTQNRKSQGRLKVGDSHVWAVRFLNRDRILAAVGDDYELSDDDKLSDEKSEIVDGNYNLSVWAFDGSSGQLSLLWKAKDVDVIAGHTDSDLLVTSDLRGCLRGYDATNGLERWKYETRSEIDFLALAPRANRMLVLDTRGHVSLLDLETRKSIASTVVIGASACALSQDGQRIWIGCRDGHVKSFEFKTAFFESA